MNRKIFGNNVHNVIVIIHYIIVCGYGYVVQPFVSVNYQSRRTPVTSIVVGILIIVIVIVIITVIVIAFVSFFFIIIGYKLTRV